MAASARRKPSTTRRRASARTGAGGPHDSDARARLGAGSGAAGARHPDPAPVDDAPRGALPLEDIAYDPETMPPAPAARGHPADAGAEDLGTPDVGTT